MQDDHEKQGPYFWWGNGILALAMLLLLFMGSLWEKMGVMAMVLWVVLAGIGAYLVMKKPDTPK